MHNKQSLRQILLAKRQSFTPSDEQSNALQQNVKTVLQSYDLNHLTLGLYWPLQGEPDLLWLAATNKNNCLPKIQGPEIVFGQYRLGEQLVAARGNLMQPASNVIAVPQIVLVPGIAFDIKGYRLGFGQGHYDKYLSQHHNIIKIGICFDQFFQLHLPYESHDITMDYIITETTILKLCQ